MGGPALRRHTECAQRAPSMSSPMSSPDCWCSAPDSSGPGVDHRRRPRLLRRRAAGGHRRSREPVAHRKGAHGDHRQRRPVPHRRSPGRRVHGHVHAARLQRRVKRDGVTLEGSFTATINADLRVGALTETITVTGESPIVDVQSVRRQMVLDNDIISAIPSSRSYNNLIQLIPNSINQAGAPTDVQVVPGMVVFGGFGGRSNEGRVNVDGISVGSAFNGAGVSSYIVDVGNAREIAMTTSGGLGETEGGGPSLNVLPKEGGNSVRGTFFVIRRHERHDRQQLHAGAEGSRPDHARRDAEGVGLQPRHRRPDRQGPRVVLREPARRRQRAHRAGHVRQQERRRPQQVDLCGRHQPSGGAGRVVSHHRAPAHRAGHAAQQVHGVLGPAAPLRRRRRGGILGQRVPHVGERRGLSPDRPPPRRRRRRPPSRPRPRGTATTATACRRRSGRRR